MAMGLSELASFGRPIMDKHWSRVQTFQAVTEEVVTKNKERLNKQVEIMDSAMQVQQQGLTMRGGRVDIQV